MPVVRRLRAIRRPSPPAGDLSCEQVAEVLQSFLDQEVEPDTVVRIGAHLDQCRRCGMEADVYLEIKRSLARSTPAVPELALVRLRHFGERLGAGVGPCPLGDGG